MSTTVNMDLLNALAAQLGREKVVAMCEAFLKPSASKEAGKVKKPKEAPAPATAASAGGEDKPKRVLPFKLIQWQAFVRYAKERFPERFEGVKGAPAMQAVCKSLKEEEGIWKAFEASPSCPQPALEPAHNTSGWEHARRSSPGPMPPDSDEETEDEAAPAPAATAGGEEAKPKRKWSEEAKASAAAKRAAKKAAKKASKEAGGSDSSDSESVASAGSAKVKAE